MTTPLERLREALLNHGEFSFNWKHRVAIIETLEAVVNGCKACPDSDDYPSLCKVCPMDEARLSIQPLLEEES